MPPSIQTGFFVCASAVSLKPSQRSLRSLCCGGDTEEKKTAQHDWLCLLSALPLLTNSTFSNMSSPNLTRRAILLKIASSNKTVDVKLVGVGNMATVCLCKSAGQPVKRKSCKTIYVSSFGMGELLYGISQYGAGIAEVLIVTEVIELQHSLLDDLLFFLVMELCCSVLNVRK